MEVGLFNVRNPNIKDWIFILFCSVHPNSWKVPQRDRSAGKRAPLTVQSVWQVLSFSSWIIFNYKVLEIQAPYINLTPLTPKSDWIFFFADFAAVKKDALTRHLLAFTDRFCIYIVAWPQCAWTHCGTFIPMIATFSNEGRWGKIGRASPKYAHLAKHYAKFMHTRMRMMGNKKDESNNQKHSQTIISLSCGQSKWVHFTAYRSVNLFYFVKNSFPTRWWTYIDQDCASLGFNGCLSEQGTELG